MQPKIQNDVRTWDEHGVFYVQPRPAPSVIRSRLAALGEMIAVGLFIVLILFGCNSCDEAQASQKIAVTFTNHHFPFGADAAGRPVHPISHHRDGRLRIGTATAYGE